MFSLSTELRALQQIVSQQSAPTKATKNRNRDLYGLLTTNPMAIQRYYTGNMQLYMKSNVVYLVLSSSKSHIPGYF